MVSIIYQTDPLTQRLSCSHGSQIFITGGGTCAPPSGQMGTFRETSARKETTQRWAEHMDTIQFPLE